MSFNGERVACAGGIENLHDITLAPGDSDNAVIDSLRLFQRALEDKGFGIRPVVFNRLDFPAAGESAQQQCRNAQDICYTFVHFYLIDI